MAAGQYVAYTFYRADPAWRRLPVEERIAGKDAFAEVVEDWAPRFNALRAYTTTGVRPDCDFFLWKITERYLDLGELGAALNGTPKSSRAVVKQTMSDIRDGAITCEAAEPPFLGPGGGWSVATPKEVAAAERAERGGAGGWALVGVPQ